MNHPSEWARFFDENTGSYRYKHKGSGVIRDTLMTIGKTFKGTIKNMAKKTTEKATKTIAEKAGQKVGELAVEKGLKQIEKKNYKKRKKKPKKQKPVSLDTKKKLANILQNQVPKKSDDALVNSAADNQNWISGDVTRNGNMAAEARYTVLSHAHCKRSYHT